jgi:hypothetical protein
MRRALHDGARGITPTRPSRSAPASTQATTVMAGARRGADTAPATAVVTRRPRQGQPRARPAAAKPPPRARPAGNGRGRLLVILLGLLALALVVVAIVVLSAPAPTKVVLRNVVYNDVQQATSALQQLISENTK